MLFKSASFSLCLRVGETTLSIQVYLARPWLSSLVKFELNDGIIGVHLLAILEGNNEASREFRCEILPQLHNLVVVG